MERWQPENGRKEEEEEKEEEAEISRVGGGGASRASPPPPPPGNKRPKLLRFRSDKRFIVFVVAMAVFTDIFLYGLIVPVFPFALGEKANVAQGDIQQWVSVLLAVYGAGLLASSPICGYLADRTSGRRMPFMAGLLALTGATVMLCIGSSIPVLVVGRLLQGISAAVVWTVGLALLADTVGKEEIGKSMGIVSAAMSLGIFLAPLLGGVVYDKGGYYSVFAMAFALIAFDIVLRLVVIEKKTAMLYIEHDGAALGPEDAAAPRDDPPTTNLPLAQEENIGADSRATVPEASRRRFWVGKLPPVVTLLRHPRFLNALWASLMQAVISTSFETTLPLYVRDTFGFGPTGAGLIFLPVIIPTFAAPLTGMLSDRYGPRFVATAGFACSVPFLILLRLPDKDTMPQIVLFCALLVLVGLSLAFIIAPVMAEFTLSVREFETAKPGRFGPNGALAQAYSLFNVAFAGGSLVGPLLAGFLNKAAGWKVVTLVLGLLCAATAVPTVIYTGGLINKEEIKLWKTRTQQIRTRVQPVI